MFRNRQLIFWVVLLSLLPISNAQAKTGLRANPYGELALSIVASDSPEYIREWLNTPSEHAVTIKRVKSVKPNQLLVTAFFVTGLTSDTNGNYEYSVDVYILSPDNEPIWGQRNYARGRGILTEKPMIMIADPALDLVLESSDPKGVYQIVGRVTDEVSTKTADYSYSIELENEL